MTLVLETHQTQGEHLGDLNERQVLLEFTLFKTLQPNFQSDPKHICCIFNLRNTEAV